MPGVRQPTPTRHKYLVIAADLEHAIRIRKLRPGFNIPSERELADNYGTTRQTVRAAIDRLSSAGLVLRDHLGTYVLAGRSSGSGDPADPFASSASWPGPSEHFPGLLLKSDVLHCTGLLTGSGRSRTSARAKDDGAVGHAPYLYRHWAYAHDGRIVQSSISSFHHRLVSQAPPLAKAVAQVSADVTDTAAADKVSRTRPPGVDPDLGELLGWLSLRFPDAQRTDQVRALPNAGRQAVEGEPNDLDPAAHVHVERTFEDADGLVLLRTVFHVFDDQARLTFQPGAAASTAAAEPAVEPPAQIGGAHLSDRDRAWLEAWLLPRSPDRALADRARIILACARSSPRRAAAELNISDDRVRAWLGRYAAGGIDALRQPVRTPRSISINRAAASPEVERARRLGGTD
jgi:hypothetical protein